MEKSLCLFLFLCSALLEVQCLECYICDNCPKAKLDEIQTCGPTTITKPSTTTTESPATTTVTTKLSTTSASTTLKFTTEAISEFTTISSKIPTEAITTSTTTTEAATTTEIRPTSTESTTSTVELSTAALIPTNTPMIIPADDITSSTVTTITISDFPSTATEFQQITTPTEASISSALLTKPNITDATTRSTTTMEPTILKESISEPVISTITTKEDSDPTDSTVSFISTLPTTTAVPFATFPVTKPTIQTFSKLPMLTEQNMESTIQNIPALSLAQPISTFTKSAPNISTIDAAISQESTVNNIKPDKEANVPYSSRRMRSSSEACACKSGEKCDCLTHQRTKRYTLRGLGLSKEAVKYVCFVDKYKVNETEIVKRGCAIKEADEKTLCTKLGFGGDCKICDTHQCNGATVIQASILLMFSLIFI